MQREVLDAFDHTYLNEQIPAFQDVVPTTENVCREIFRRLEGISGRELERVRIEETSRNSFEYRSRNFGRRPLPMKETYRNDDLAHRRPPETIADWCGQVRMQFGEDPNREGLRHTPERLRRRCGF